MKEKLKKVLLRFILVQIMVGLLFFFPAYTFAQVVSSNCVVTAVGNPQGQPQLPANCPTNIGNTSCSPKKKFDIPYTVNGRSLSVTVWPCEPAPLVIFLPGRFRSANDYERYEQAIADQGFTVAGINFPASENSDGSMLHLTQMVDDTKSILDKLAKEPKLNVKTNNVGLIGHSDGGYTVLMEGYMGNNDSRIKAIIAEDGKTQQGENSSGPPLLVIYGQNDTVEPVQSSIDAYNNLSATPKYLAEILGADHFCYVTEKGVPGYPCNQTYTPQSQALDDLTVAFLNRNLNGCNDPLQNVQNQNKNYINLKQTGNDNGGQPCSSSGSVAWPFGAKENKTTFRRIDQGWDFQGTSPQIIYAVAAGTVFKANNDPSGFGDFYPYIHLDKPIIIKSTLNKYTDVYYGHIHYADGGTHYGIQTPNVLGRKVKAGSIIGYTYPGCCWPANWLEIGFGNNVPVAGGYPGATVQGLDMEEYLIGTRKVYQ
ncbi:MAG TPA: alpha/beta hydrolase [Patescibacteria group bacterium]